MRTNFIIFKLLGGFSIVGVITTLISLVAIYVFLKVFQTPLIETYIIIYVVSIILSFLLNSLFVFKSSLSFNNGIKYSMVYFSGMMLGTMLLWVFEQILPYENYIIGYLVLPFTMVWNFILSYKILKPIQKC